MKKTENVSKVFGFAAALLFVLFAIPASAHFMWINAGNYAPAADSDATINIGYGHSFGNPVGNVLLDLEKLDEIYMLDPGGAKLEVKPANATDFKTEGPMKNEGTYLVVGKKKEEFSSKTTDGYKYQSKKELKNVIQCNYSGGYVKAIVNAGMGGGDAFSKPAGHTLEIVPLTDPANLKQGDYISLKVLYKGEPLRADVFATYAGFSTEGAWAYTTGTNKDGVSRVKILVPGVWLIKVGHKESFPDPKECDQYSFTSTLTFEVK